jgi:hypothetical protein
LLQRKLAAQEPPPFYAALAAVTGALFAADAAYLRDAIDRAPAAA